jgi:hypothetical protein
MTSSNVVQEVETQISSLDTQLLPLETQISSLRRAKNAQIKALKKYMETNDITSMTVNGVRYYQEQESNVKCTMERMRNTLPEDVVEEYVQHNTVEETKWKKEKV